MPKPRSAPAGGEVGVERVGIDVHVLDVVRARGAEAGLLRHARADVGVGAAVPVHLALAGDDLAVPVDAALDPERAGVLGDLVEALLHRQRDLHRPPHQQRQRGDQRLQLDVELRAVAAAEIGHADAHAVLRQAEQAGDLGAHERRALRRGVDRHRVALGVADRDERLEREMQHLLGAERVLEHVRGLGKALLDVAAPQLEVERHVGVLAAGEVLEVGERAGGLELVVHVDLGVERLDLVVDRRQLLVLGGDLLHGLLGDVRIGREHHRDRLADEPHLLVGEDRLVVERRAVIRVRDHGLDVVDGDDAVDAGHLLRRAGVDRLDAAVRDRAAEDLGVQHAGQAQIVGVLGAPRDLVARFEPRQRAADLAADRAARNRRRAHQCAPFPASAIR